MNYTHRDASGMPWRFVGSRPVSQLADEVMAECGLAYYGEERQIGLAQKPKPKRKRKGKK